MEKVKPISRELKSQFVKHLCELIASENQLENAFRKEGTINHFIIFSNESYNSEEILKLMNTKLPNELRQFIETETGESAKEYDRSVILFESEPTEATLTITW